MQFLIHEPASMLDLGLYRLRDSVTAVVNDDSKLSRIGLKPPINVQTTYDLARNQIHIRVIAPLPPSYLLRRKPTETCGQLVGLVEAWMRSDAQWPGFFVHAGYESPTRSGVNLKAELADAIVIDAQVGSDATAKSVSCSEALGGVEVIREQTPH